MLSKSQKQFYNQNGYVVVKGLIPKEAIEVYINRFTDICSGKVKVSPLVMLMRDVAINKNKTKQICNSDPERVLTKMTNFHEDEVLWQYCQQPEIIGGVQDLIGNGKSTILAMNTMVINKPPDAGQLSSRHPLHQDLHYFPFRPADFICCAWTAMERITRANGCLVVVPGSHKGPLLEHDYPEWKGAVNSVYHGIKAYSADLNMVHLEMDTGDTVFFHPLLIHGSGANRTSGYRKAITGHFANDDVCRYIDYEDLTTKLAAKEFEEISKKVMKRFDADVKFTYHDFWRIRAKEISGVRSNL
ncbi:unnamed protein product [Caenorhabditis bovis]|uniref:phytanoyl-CoA dioxygenase n=1 Tax=Caenorhabditis bovis TaxID=2654633 RepID=A0A8S1ECN9_9PELO|nr:unnamed protein product [Caenorhabditis bovis]